MRTVELDQREAPNKWWAYHDASMRNIANASHYTQAQKIQAERMKLVLEMVYSAKSVYIAFGKKGYSIKVHQALVRDRRTLHELEEEWARQGFIKKITPQGVTYRLDIR